MNYKKMFDELVTVIEKQVPGFEARYKNENGFQKFLGIITKPFCPTYMTSYTTTQYPYVYFTTREYVDNNHEAAFRTLAHEYVHLVDYRDGGRVWWDIMYLMPQSLSLLSLLAFLAFWKIGFLAFLGFLICLAPFPSPWRSFREIRGYAMSCVLDEWIDGALKPEHLVSSAKQFTGWGYYKMNPDYDDAHLDLRILIMDILCMTNHATTTLLTYRSYLDVKNIIMDNKNGKV